MWLLEFLGDLLFWWWPWSPDFSGSDGWKPLSERRAERRQKKEEKKARTVVWANDGSSSELKDPRS